MPLYHVEITYTSVVIADDVFEAREVARWTSREAVGDATEADINVTHEIKSAKDFRDGWDEKCIPYGLDRRDTTIGQILKGEA